MTVTTTINSILLTFGPIYAAYNGFRLRDYKAYPAFLYGVFAYVLTSIVKFLALAILTPILLGQGGFGKEGEAHVYTLEQNVLLGLVGLLDVVGLYILFNQKKLIVVMGDNDIKILGVGLGWAAGDLVANNLLYCIL